MFIGYDLFGLNNGSNFIDILPLDNINYMEIYSGLIDEIYIDENIDSVFSENKPTLWGFSTVLHAKFNEDLEAGSVAAGGFTIDKIKIQKREIDEFSWSDVTELVYNPDDKLLYEQFDPIVANNFIYQYSLLPVAAEVLGNRVLSNNIEVDFEGVFLSDKTNNYHLLYDATVNDITHISPSVKFEPLNAQYPIVSYSSLDYAEWEINATFISATSKNNADGAINIRAENKGRKQLLDFLKNKKPKIYRDMHGNLKLVTVVDNPSETLNSSVNGLGELGIKLVEIDTTDSDTLKQYNLLVGDF